MGSSVERAIWSNQDTKIFLEICIEMKAGAKSQKTNWAKIVQNLNLATGKTYTDRKVRNKYDDLRALFKFWNEMELKWTGLAFDPGTGVPLIEQDDRWGGFVEKHKGVPNRFLKKPLAHLSLLRSLYSGSFASSQYSYSPACETGKKLLRKERHNTGDKGSGDSDDSESYQVHYEHEISDEGSKSPPTSCSKGKRKSAGSVSSSKKARSDIQKCLDILKMSIKNVRT